MRWSWVRATSPAGAESGRRPAHVALTRLGAALVAVALVAVACSPGNRPRAAASPARSPTPTPTATPTAPATPTPQPRAPGPCKLSQKGVGQAPGAAWGVDFARAG